MRRRISNEKLAEVLAPPAHEEAQRTLAEFLGPEVMKAERKKRNRRVDADARMAEVVEMMMADPVAENGVWSKAKPIHFVMLMRRWFRMTYGVEDAELEHNATMLKAAGHAARMIEGEFAGDSRAFFRYLGWQFREAKRWNEKRAADGTDGWRLGWYYLLVGRKAITSYRIALARQRGQS